MRRFGTPESPRASSSSTEPSRTSLSPGDWESPNSRARPELPLWVSTNPVGALKTTLLPPGDYILRAQPDGTNLLTINYYTTNGVPALFPEEASVVDLSTNHITNLVLMLHAGGSISGTIRTTNGIPLDGVDLDVFNGAGRLMEASARSDSNGFYVIGAFPAGDYTVRCDPDPEHG